MLKVNYLSDFLKFEKFIGINGAMNATKNQARAMQKYVQILINDYGTNYDLIHSHGCFPYTFKAVKKGKKLKKPIVISAHQTHHDTDVLFLLSKPISKLFKKYLMRYYKLGDVLICPTQNSKKIVRNELNITKPIKLISNGVNTQKFKHSNSKREIFRKNYRLSKTTIISVGMPTRRKGFFDFIEISKNYNEFKFLWVGKRAFPFIQRNYQINKNSLIMPGYIRDIVAAYSGCDIFCSLSHYEGEGIAILEAMSCGLPVIMRDLPVHKERFFDGINCLKAKTNKEFIEKIYYLKQNPIQCKKISINGLKTAKDLDIEITTKQIYNTYLELME